MPDPIPTSEIRLQTDFIAKTMQLYVYPRSNGLPNLNVNWKTAAPHSMIDMAIQFIAFIKVRYPAYANCNITCDEKRLKQKYYQDRTMLARPLAPPPAFWTPTPHTCTDFNSLNPGFQRTNGAFDQQEQIPDIIGELVGWKGWNIDGYSLISGWDGSIWTPRETFTARCKKYECTPPCINCSCGVYAAQEKANATGVITGKVKMWGRFLKGKKGYRAQHAYPLEFHLELNQLPHLDWLKNYNVPIYTHETRIVQITLFDPNEKPEVEEL